MCQQYCHHQNLKLPSYRALAVATSLALLGISFSITNAGNPEKVLEISNTFRHYSPDPIAYDECLSEHNELTSKQARTCFEETLKGKTNEL